ncbi:MAG TPA: maleylpyruvate isomerase family mycothiol-dependent enzyme [Candidatus Dormibacteraeota bacterium]|nr:maleylpyruvate isomerase family mycothiol-dependent enzyme [Candidatus Dormibacteraeota bacterium]
MTASAPPTGHQRAGSIWPLVHAERAALAEDLAALDEAQWAHPSLCERWVVEDVVAHLTAGASVGRLRWFASVLGARFDFDLHNDRRLAEHRGATPAETLERFRRIVTSTTSAPGPTAAWLGEIVVHAQDIRRPLGLVRMPQIGAVTEVARFYARRNFTVAGRTAIEGLRVEATDGPFATGAGPLVSGTTLALTMAMAGRRAYCDDLTGPGATIVRARCSPG